jgi:hypothetical protein
MRSKTAKRILEETSQETKEKVQKWAEEIIEHNKTNLNNMVTKEQLAEEKSSSEAFKEQHKKDFIAGFNAAQKTNWINVEYKLPETYIQHRNIWESDEVLLDCGDFYAVSRYVKKYSGGSDNLLIWEGFDDFEEIGFVKRWMQIPQ